MAKALQQQQARLAQLSFCQVQVGKIRTYIDTLTSEPSANERRRLEDHLVDLKECQIKYENIYFELEQANPDLLASLPTISDFFDDYYTLRGEIRSILQSTEEKTIAVPNQLTRTPQEIMPMLKALDPPQFYGKITEYVSFKANFRTLLDISPYTDTQKLIYLKQAVKGNAANTISSLPVESGNYEIAWQLLDQRFLKPKLITQTYIKGILNLNTAGRNPSTLQVLTDSLISHMTGLNAVQVTGTKLADALLYQIIESKLDSDSTQALRSCYPEIIPSVDEQLDFLRRRVSILVATKDDTPATSRSSFHPKPEFKSAVKPHIMVTNSRTPCVLCKGDHILPRCKQFIALTMSEREKCAERHRLCKKCLCHSTQSICQSQYICRGCKRPVHVLLHKCSTSRNNPTNSGYAATSSTSPDVIAPGTSSMNINATPFDNSHTLSCGSLPSRSIILLSTANVVVKDQFNQPVSVRCLLDCGSTQNLLTQRLADKLNLPTESIAVTLQGVANKETLVKSSAQLEIRSRYTNFQKKLNCLVIDHITSPIPTVEFSIDKLKIPDNIILADPNFNVPADIDLLIGAQHFYGLLLQRNLPSNIDGLRLQESLLGFLVTGNVPIKDAFTFTASCLNAQVNFDLQRFWDIEQVPSPAEEKTLSETNQLCLQYFKDTIRQEVDGKLTVSMPCNSSISQLGTSYDKAERLFFQLERRLSRSPELKLQYANFIKEYEHLNHLTQITVTDRRVLNYLPHHAVLKPESTSTKLRVVFNGSFKTSTGYSLNDCLHAGPVVQRDLFTILLNFRQFKVCFTADCTKMYRQIWLDPDQRKYQCILWRENKDEELRILQLNTITYGLKSSSFLASNCLRYIASQVENDYPSSANKIKNDFYMDDLITGTDSVKEAQESMEEIQHLLGNYGIPLCKFRSNIPKLQSENSEGGIVFGSEPESSKILGICWNSTSDLFIFQLADNNIQPGFTKRQILSNLSKTFDPLGLISPLIISGKLIMQEIWKRKISWDDEVPNDIANQWRTFLSNITQAATISFPRCTFEPQAETYELHCFSDASMSAYGCCIYVRSKFNNQCQVHLLCSKSKVAPLKTISLPRLELLAATLSVELTDRVRNIFLNKLGNIFYYSDSTIVLNWIQHAPSDLQTFVANRVARIQELSSVDQWRHIAGLSNPADLTSRGSNADSISSDLWMQGPAFLKIESFQASPYCSIPLTSLPEVKHKDLVHAVRDVDNPMLNLVHKLSNYSKLLRIQAFALRFIHNCRSAAVDRKNGPLSIHELQKAQLLLIRCVQRVSFADEIHSLTQSPPKKIKNHVISSLSIFLDNQGLIRVGGRIRHSNLVFDKIHPILLPKGHHLTFLILSDLHLKNLHCGPTQLLALARDQFWPISGITICKAVVRRCIICFRVKPIGTQPIMGDLPASRFAANKRCFYHCGVDFAGPLLMKDRYSRNSPNIKVYICAFVCMTTRAIHLELVTNLSSEAFIGAFQRFVARRGKPHQMISDNGTNFIASSDQLKDIFSAFESSCVQTSLTNFLNTQNIEWKFIPPSSPFFGGVWESGIRRVKHHLTRVLRGTLLTFEHLYTIISRIESVLNSRPLSPMTSDPSSFDVLTPSHFLFSDSGCYWPTTPSAPSTNHLKQYRQREQLVLHFWQRWWKEVLPELQRRSKWDHQPACQQAPRVGQLALLQQPNTRPYQWPLGRIIELYPGSDGVVRVVSVRTSTGSVFKRPVSRVYVLPCQDQEDA